MMASGTRLLLSACALAALALSAPRSATAGPAEVKFEPKARELWDQVVLAYKNLDSYADHGAFRLALTADGQPHARVEERRLTFSRPNKIALDAGLARVVCDGSTLTTAIAPLRQYTSVPAPERITFDTLFTGGSLGSALFGGPEAPMMTLLLALMVSEDPTRALSDLGDSVSLADDRELDKETCRVLRLTGANRPALLLLADPGTKLLRGIELRPDPAGLAGAFPKGRAVTIERYEWTAGAVSTDAALGSAFAFNPPEGFTKVGGLAKAVAAAEDEPEAKVQKLVGKPAPEFTLTLLDGPGKTRTVTRADLAGKVVMIDFWATWCDPCLAELPEVQKLIESYGEAKKDRDVVIVALSQDDSPKDPFEVRKLIEATLSKKKIELTATPVGKIGLDPSNTVGEAFSVEGYPTVVLIDRKGVVRAAHLGFSPDVGRVLKGEIDALMEGKPVGKDAK